MTEDELNEELMTVGATALSTQYFLSAFIRILRDDGLVSQEQIRRAVAHAKSNLEAVQDPIRIRASVLLEPEKGAI